MRVLALVLLAFTPAVSASGTTPPIPSQDFGQVLIKGTASTQTLALSFTAQSVAPTFSLAYQPGEFSLGTAGCTTTSCTVNVTFSPQYPGLRQNAVIARNASRQVIGMVFVHGIGLAPQASMHPGVITTVAGNRGLGFGGDGGAATLASLWSPQGIAVNPAGDVLIADTLNQLVRKVSASGTITTVSSGVFTSPTGLALDAAGNIYVADYGANVVREINGLTGSVTVFAGGGSPASGLGDGGAAINAKLSGPSDVAVDSAGNVFIADTNNGLIRKVNAAGIMSTVAGGGTITVAPWGDGAAALTAALSSPQGVALDPGGNVLYIADTGHHVIRYVVLSGGVISTMAGNGNAGYLGDSGPALQAQLDTPVGLTVDAAGDLYIADFGSNVVREVLAGSGVITTVAGTGLPGFTPDGGSPLSTQFFGPRNIALESTGNLLIADNANNVIRKVTFSLLGLNFGNVNVGLESTAQAQTVFNIGNRPLDFSALSITGNFRQDTSNAWDCSSSSIVLPGEGCVISVQSIPVAAGTSSGTITFTANSLNSSGSNQTGLTGGGTSGSVPQLQISTAGLTFPAQTVGTMSAAQTVVVKNTGAAVLNISSIWLTGSNVGAFQITGSNCAAVAVGASCTVSVVFAPQSTGSQSAGITFSDALVNSPQTVPVSGTAIPSLNQIAVGSDGSVWGLDGAGKVYAYDVASGSLQSKPGALSQIAVGSSGNVWGLTQSGAIYRWNAGLQNWDQIAGSLARIAVGSDGDVWGVNSFNQVWHFNPQTQGWNGVAGSLTRIAVGFTGAVWGLQADGEIYRYNGSAGTFQKVPGALSQIAWGQMGMCGELTVSTRSGISMPEARAGTLREV